MKCSKCGRLFMKGEILNYTLDAHVTCDDER